MTFKDSSADNAIIGNWLIEGIEGCGVIDNAQSTIQIADDGSVTGSTGVNRYMSKARIDDQQITFELGPATTRMPGPPALMDQESKFLAAFHRVAKYNVDEKGLLHLLDESDKEVFRASPTE